MSPTETTVLVLVSGAAGALGALLGLGGGIVIVPLLVHLGVPVPEATGTSLVCVLATSAAGSVAQDRGRVADPRLVAHLSVATTVGAALAGRLADVVPARLVCGLFALATAWSMVRLSARLRTPLGVFPAPPPAEASAPPQASWPRAWPLGLAGSLGAGLASGLLGIGGAPIKVPLMTEVMGVPPAVAFATSNVMVGITAAASAAVFYGRGHIRADLVGPCAVAAAAGALGGGLLAPRLRSPRPLVALFVAVLALVTGKMLWKAIAPAS